MRYAWHAVMAPPATMHPAMLPHPNVSYAFQPYTFQPTLHPGASYINIPQHPDVGYGASPYADAGYVPQTVHELDAAMSQYGEYYCNPTPRLAPPGPEEWAWRHAPPPPPPPPTPVAPMPAAMRRILMPLCPKVLLRNLAGCKSSPNLHRQLQQEQGGADWESEILDVEEISQPRRPSSASGASGASGSSGETAVSRFSNVSAEEPRRVLSRSRSSIGLAKIRSKLFPGRKKDGPLGLGSSN
jgi:hypothetical protein